MHIKTRLENNIVVLELSEKIDVNSANFVEVVGQCVRDGYCDIVCNFSEVDAIDYMGMSVIVIAYKEVANHKGRMKFCNMPVHLKNLFSVVGLDRVIEMYPTLEIAVNSFQEDKIIEDIQKLHLRRRFKRLPLDIKIEMKEKYANSPHCVQADIMNLSAIGAYIYGCDKFKLGDEVVMHFKLSDGEEFQLDAKVVWLCDKQIQIHMSPGMGVAFHNIDTATQEKIAGFIERNLSMLSRTISYSLFTPPCGIYKYICVV